MICYTEQSSFAEVIASRACSIALWWREFKSWPWLSGMNSIEFQRAGDTRKSKNCQRKSREEAEYSWLFLGLVYTGCSHPVFYKYLIIISVKPSSRVPVAKIIGKSGFVWFQASRQNVGRHLGHRLRMQAGNSRSGKVRFRQPRSQRHPLVSHFRQPVSSGTFPLLVAALLVLCKHKCARVHIQLEIQFEKITLHRIFYRVFLFLRIRKMWRFRFLISCFARERKSCSSRSRHRWVGNFWRKFANSSNCWVSQLTFQTLSHMVFLT